jgi:hypothetical protein
MPPRTKQMPQQEAIEGESERLSSLPMLTAPAPDNDSDDDADLSAVLNELDGDTQATVKLYRSLRGGKLSFVEEYRPNEWLEVGESGVRDAFGAGEYEIRVYDNRKKIRKRKSFSIDSARASNPIAPTPAPVDTRAIIAEIIRELAPMFASITRPAAQPQDRQQYLQELILMKQIFAPDGAAKAAADPLEMLSKLIGVTKELQPREGETGPYDVFARLVETFGPMITSNIAQAQASAAAAAPAPGAPSRRLAAGPPVAAPVVPIQVGAEPQANPAPSQPQEDTNMLAWAIRFLVAQAERKADPGLYAELAADHLSDEQLAQVLAADDGALIATLSSHDARVAQHAEWFIAMRNELRALLTDAPEPGDNPATGENTTPQA